MPDTSAIHIMGWLREFFYIFFIVLTIHPWYHTYSYYYYFYHLFHFRTHTSQSQIAPPPITPPQQINEEEKSFSLSVPSSLTLHQQTELWECQPWEHGGRHPGWPPCPWGHIKGYPEKTQYHSSDLRNNRYKTTSQVSDASVSRFC